MEHSKTVTQLGIPLPPWLLAPAARISQTEAQKSFAPTVDRAFRGEALVLTHHGRPRVAMISYEDFQTVIALLQRLEDYEDAEADDASVREGGAVSWKEAKQELDLD